MEPGDLQNIYKDLGLYNKSNYLGVNWLFARNLGE